MSAVSDIQDRVIVALDVPSMDAALEIVNRLGDQVSTYKVGHQLMTAAGPRVIAALKSTGKQVFLDLKLHEIPNSVASAVTAAANIGVDMVTLHASGGTAMMRAAVSASEQTTGIKILALTVVTGMTDADLLDIGVGGTVTDQVVRLASLAAAAGVHGVVASPAEVSLLRRVLPPDMWIVTPGVRLADAAADDQARVGTPAQAVAAGASYIVIGRPIVAAVDPLLALQQVRQQMLAM